MKTNGSVSTSKSKAKKSHKERVEEEIKRAYYDIGKAVERASGGSALHGLEVVAFAFSAILDVYAKPNAENPLGMSDDPQAFRRHFAEIVAGAAVCSVDDSGEGTS